MSYGFNSSRLGNPWKWQDQPYVSWKDDNDIKYASVPKWSRPLTNNYPTKKNPEIDLQSLKEQGGYAPYRKSPNWWNKARPIKHWRKQLQARNVDGISRSSYTIQYNNPGSSSFTSKYLGENNENNENKSNCCSFAESSNIIWENFNKNVNELNKSNKISNAAVVLYDNNQKKCISCDPISNRIRPTAGMNNKLINPNKCTPDKNNNLCKTPLYKCESPNKKYSFNTAQYLKSRNKSYETNLSGSLINGVKYSNLNDNCCADPIPYSNSSTYENDPSKLGPQVRKSLSQSDYCNSSKNCINIVVKPNNQTFFQQGAVSSSSRIERLKYNTVQSNIKSIGKAWGEPAANANQYNGSFIAPITLKSKNNKCNKSLFHAVGNKTVCFKLG